MIIIEFEITYKVGIFGGYETTGKQYICAYTTIQYILLSKDLVWYTFFLNYTKKPSFISSFRSTTTKNH